MTDNRNTGVCSGAVVALTIAGLGEPFLRLEKRLTCAAGAIGRVLQLTVRKDYEMLGLSADDTPAVLHEGKVIFSGLPRTEEIEAWLKQLV